MIALGVNTNQAKGTSNMKKSIFKQLLNPSSQSRRTPTYLDSSFGHLPPTISLTKQQTMHARALPLATATAMAALAHAAAVSSHHSLESYARSHRRSRPQHLDTSCGSGRPLHRVPGP
jgi:hypothetical protein